MLPAQSNYETLPLLTQILYGIGIAICLALGVIGVILPIIPGIPFLFFAVLLAAKLSPRVDLFLHTDPHVSQLKAKFSRFWRSSGELQPTQQLKLVGLLAIRSVFDSVKFLVSLIPTRRTQKSSKP